MPPTILDKIVAQKKSDLELTKSQLPLAELIKRVESLNNKNPLSFFQALSEGEGPNIIAEIKRVSPSKGPLRPDLDPIELAKDYARSGAKAISVLTEEKFFHGSSADLLAVRANTNIPILRKDFTIDEYQIWEAKLLGASAILLIAAILEEKQILQFYNLAQQLGLDALIEVHDEAEMRKILNVKPQIVGVNNRNLHNFEVSLDVSKKLIGEFKNAEIPVWVSESGISEKQHICELMDCGFKGFLIGESLLRVAEPASKLKELVS